jgi:hypothetical protein
MTDVRRTNDLVSNSIYHIVDLSMAESLHPRPQPAYLGRGAELASTHDPDILSFESPIRQPLFRVVTTQVDYVARRRQNWTRPLVSSVYRSSCCGA